jgi:peptide/nickel transport system permease protein
VVRGVVDSSVGRAGLTITSAIALLAFVGPWLAPYDPTATLMLPLEPPSVAHLMGADGLGRDALSRYLNGGQVLVAVAFAATIFAYVIGIPLGMAIGYRRGLCDVATIALADLILAFPAIIFVLVLAAAAGTSLLVVIIGIATINLPRVVRIARTVTIDLVTREFVEASIARGESLLSILRSDILPNIWTPILADFGIRLTGSIILFSSLSYLGFGQQPPAADWGLMISENRVALFLQPWVIVVPALTIALLCIGVNLIADGVARSAGHSIVGRDA